MTRRTAPKEVATCPACGVQPDHLQLLSRQPRVPLLGHVCSTSDIERHHAGMARVLNVRAVLGGFSARERKLLGARTFRVHNGDPNNIVTLLPARLLKLYTLLSNAVDASWARRLLQHAMLDPGFLEAAFAVYDLHSTSAGVARVLHEMLIQRIASMPNKD